MAAAGFGFNYYIWAMRRTLTIGTEISIIGYKCAMEDFVADHVIELPSDVLLDIRQEPHHADTVIHRHQFSELVIVTRGSALHRSPGGVHPIGAGDVFVLHGNQYHGYSESDALELINILFRMEQLALPLRDIDSLPGYHVLFTLEPALREQDNFESRLQLSAEQLNAVEVRVQAMLREREVRAPGCQFAMLAHFMLIVCDLCRFYSHLDTPEARSLLRLGSVLGYMRQNFADPITLDQLAEVGCMSRRTLTREFREVLGSSPIDYLIRERIGRAKEMLEDSSMTISEVAYRVGFQDSNYFSRKFREVTGVSPRGLRRVAGHQMKREY